MSTASPRRAHPPDLLGFLLGHHCRRPAGQQPHQLPRHLPIHRLDRRPATVRHLLPRLRVKRPPLRLQSAISRQYVPTAQMSPSRPSEEYHLTASPYLGNLSAIPRYEAVQIVQQSHSEGALTTNRGSGDRILSHRVGRVSPWHAKPRAESVRGRIIRVPGREPLRCAL